jgi:hypothetical protein
MTIVIGYLVAVAVAVAVLWVVAGRNFKVVRDPQLNLAELGGRHVGILSGLAGYAVTGMVLLVTLGRTLLDNESTSYTTVVTMFFISWMAYSGTAFLFANLSDPKPSPDFTQLDTFDTAAAQFAGGAATLEFAFGLAWLALRPLFEAFGLVRLADLVAFVSIAVAFASYGLVAHHLHRSGYGPTRVLVAVLALTVAAALAYGLIVGMLGLRSDEATLNLIVSGFCIGVIAFFALLMISAATEHVRARHFLCIYGPYLILAFVQANVLLVGFLLLAVLGYA